MIILRSGSSVFLIDFVNKEGLEPNAGQKVQVGLPSPRRKRETKGKGGFSAMLWNNKKAAVT